MSQEEEWKKEMKKLVKEAVSEELKSSQPSTGYPKIPRKKTSFDQTRAIGPNPMDPRSNDQTWPCFGQHQPSRFNNNRYAQWQECQACGLRLMYVPEINAKGQSAHMDLPQNVQEALHRLRGDGWDPKELTTKVVKSAIRIMAEEKSLKKEKGTSSAKPSQETASKAKQKTTPEQKAEGQEQEKKKVESVPSDTEDEFSNVGE